RALSDLVRELIDILGEDAPGKADHHRRVQRLAGAQAVDGDLPAVGGTAVFERRIGGARRWRQTCAQRRDQHRRWDAQLLTGLDLIVRERVELADLAEVLTLTGEPHREPPQARSKSPFDSLDLMDPGVGL